MHCFKSRGASFSFGFYAESTHIVESVAQLYENDADILRHGEKHFTDVFHIRFFLVLDVYYLHFGKSVYKHSNVITETLSYRLDIRLIRTVLDGIVQKSRAYRVRVKSERRYYLSDCYGMGDIRLAADTELSLVQSLCVKICSFDFLYVVMLFAVLYHRHELVNIDCVIR